MKMSKPDIKFAIAIFFWVVVGVPLFGYGIAVFTQRVNSPCECAR